MRSIRKIALIPLKWASKEILHRTLLRFPGGKSHDPIACTYCPEMCRFACPTAVVSGNDAVTPCNKMSLLHKEERWPGRAADGGELWPLYDCTGCGRCTNYCVYGMPVMEQLFSARKKHGWVEAKRVAEELTDASDPIGDLADELGDEVNALRRVKKFASRFKGSVCLVREPRSLFFLAHQGFSGSLSWEPALYEEPNESAMKLLRGKKWLLHESSWMNRNLGRTDQISRWVEGARSAGAEIVLPYHHGKDCIDSGGEGAYARLFPEQSAQMARDLWERDSHRADGILCVSQRSAEHVRRTLGKDVTVCSFPELFGEA